MNSTQKVFCCDDIRKHILSFLPVRCKSCHNIMKIVCKNKPNSLHIKRYRNYEWRVSECVKLKNYCNWCYYYVFEYN